MHQSQTCEQKEMYKYIKFSHLTSLYDSQMHNYALLWINYSFVSLSNISTQLDQNHDISS